MEIRRFSIKDTGIREELEQLINTHWNAVQRQEDEIFELDWRTLDLFDNAGISHYIGAFNDNKLVGYLALLIVPSIHTKAYPIAQDLGWFVYEHNRKSTAGIRLLKEAELIANEHGCFEIAINLKTLKNLAPSVLLQKRGYLCTEHRYAKRLKGD